MNHLIKKTPTPSLTNKWADAAWSRHFSRSAGVAVALLGLLIIVSWHAHWQSMVQMLPRTAPMQYNTALCFVWCGAGLFLLTTTRKRMAPWFGGAAAAFALLTLLEYFMGLDFRIDQLFFKPWFHTATAFPGRMSPLTAFCFVFIGAGLVLVNAKESWPHRLAAAGMLSCVVGVIMLLALFGFVFGIESATGWGAYSRIALNTSVAFLGLSVGLLIWCWRKARLVNFDFLRWLAVIGSVTLMAMIGVISAVSMAQLKDAMFWRGHTYQVLITARSFIGNLSDVQRGMRGYVLTTSPESLELYQRATNAAPHQIAQLAEFTRNNPVQRQRLKTMADDFAAVIAYSRQLIGARDSLGLAAAVQLEKSEKGLAVDRTRADLTVFTQEEERLLAEREVVEGVNYKKTARLLVLGSVLAAGLLVLANLMASREVKRRRQSEKALRASEERFRLIVESVKDYAILMLDPFGRVTSWNSGVEHIEGYKAPEIIGQNFSKFYSAEALAAGKPEKELAQALAKGQVEDEGWRVRKDGSALFANVIITTVRDADGRHRGFVVVIRDITKRKQAEETLLQSQTLLRMAGRLSRMGSWSVELPEFKQAWSDEVCAIYGVPPGTSLSVQETINRSAPEFHETITQAFEACVRDGTPYDLELQIAGADNRSVWVRVIGEAGRDAAGVIQRVQGALQDITERKRFEAQLFQSQQMETVGKLAGGVAHEFNSILTAIMGQSELLLTELSPENPLSRNVVEISKAAGRAAGLTRQLLAYGRKQILHPEILDLNSVLSEMESTLCHLVGQKVNLLIVPAVGLKSVKIDPGQIQQVIVNLVMNAADAMPDGGKLTLETTNVSLSPESDGPSPELKLGDHVMLAITDAGTGMTEELRARIFEPFFTTKDIGQGTGLGLSTCYGIIKQSGGHIDVCSEPGWGTSFKIYLPQVNQQARIPAPKVAPPALSGGTETILLVEDDPALREMAAASLERLGYTVLAAANGVEALRLKQQDDCGPIDLLFTDVAMPQMNGKELADRIQSSSPSTRILFTSAYTENSIVHQGVLDPGVALLQKPFTPAALACKIREVLDVEIAALAGAL